ncbi:hypothetical protein ACHQM5_019223 [Ranunculus cassubicifolius]
MEEEYTIYKRVPWISWEEWNFVRKSLFSSSPHSIATALDRISMWKLRGSLPIIVDVTASIIRTQQKDPKFREDIAVLSQFLADIVFLCADDILVVLLCTSVCVCSSQLVNGVIDQDRNKRGKRDNRRLSINDSAYEIGLPRILVDIRHEASHRLDSPSLPLVSEASVKALDWIKSYYWEPQKKAIPIQKDTVEVVRKRMITKLSELASHLDAQQDSQLGSLPVKRKRPKNQTKRILKILFRLYTSFPSEVVAVLLNFLQKALDSSSDTGVEPCNDSELENSEKLEAQTRTTDLCKFVISRLSLKEPELILIMLEAVLEKLETQETAKFRNGSQSEELSSLVPWLIKRYNKIKHPSPGENCGDETSNVSAETNITPKVALRRLLKKCLLVSSLGNNQLASSALLLAQIMGNSSIVDRVTKLAGIFSGDVTEECLENSLRQDIKMLEVLKGGQNKDDDVASNHDVANNELGKWTVSKSWNPCPIGMIPSSLGSTGILPILDRVINFPVVQNAPEGEDFPELESSDGMLYGDCDAEFFDKIDANKEVEEVVGDEPDLSIGPFRGRLMIGGVYKKVYSDDLHVIENGIRILV